MIRAAKLEPALYDEVEHDTGALGQAVIIVVGTSILAGIGSIALGVETLLLTTIGALVGWAIYAWLAYFIGTRLFSGTADWGEVARGLGFAQTPRVLLVFAGVPVVGGLLALAVFVWVIVATVTALRAALDVTTGKAVATAIIAVVAQVVVYSLLFAVGAAI